MKLACLIESVLLNLLQMLHFKCSRMNCEMKAFRIERVDIIILPWLETVDWALIEMLTQVAWRSTTGPGCNEKDTALESF